MKVVGNRRYYRTGPLSVILEEYDKFLKLVWGLRPTRRLVPKGVYRFRTFEEADAWMNREIANTVAGLSSTTSSRFVAASTTPERATS